MKQFIIALFTCILIPCISYAQIDSTIYQYENEIIKGIKFQFFSTIFGSYVVKGKKDTILKLNRDYFAFMVKDFNNDGYKDIFFVLSGNTPAVYDLFIFDEKLLRFKEIENFNRFPAPELIRGTKLYYSYHKSGCADAIWDSDLFYIRNNKAIRLGNILGDGCNNSVSNDKIYIYKVNNRKKVLLKTFPLIITSKYPNDKWDFIKEYWNKNYKLFISK